MEKLRMAVIGAGRMGGFHAQKLAAFPDVELVAVCDPDADAARRVGAACRAQALRHYGELPEQIDAAVVATPSRLHHPIAAELLSRGIHVLVEKPMCVCRAEADDLAALARQQGVVLQTGHVERFNPAFVAAAPHVPAPKYIEAVRTSPFTFRSTDVGVVLDLMIHDLDLVLGLVRSPVRRVDALGLSVLGGHEDAANARIEFESGCVATLSASRVAYETQRRMQVWSRQGFAAVDFAARKTTLVRPSEAILRQRFCADRLSPPEVERCKQHLFDDHLPIERLEFEPVDALLLELRQFIDAVRSPALSEAALSGRDAVALAESVLERIAQHAWDDAVDGAVGPLARPAAPLIRAPHFAPPPPATLERRKAG